FTLTSRPHSSTLFPYTTLFRSERERLGEAVHAGLRCRVVDLPERALLAVDRRDVDDATPAALDHAVADLFGHVEAAVEVGLDHRSEEHTSELQSRFDLVCRLLL